MMYSKERMDFIIDYMSAYEQKIKLANKNGLFDNAKMFELFAQNICGLYFNQKFYNLNDERCNFPYFDLISEDKKIYIQVSTTLDVKNKIKSTLENVRDNKDNKYSEITEVYFFVLHNDKITKIKNYTGKKQIGNIPFDKSKNLITTLDIVTRSKNDIKFQEDIFILLKQEFENYNEISLKFSEALDISKNVGIKNIDVKINGEYEIDRSDFLKRIKDDNNKFISIQGMAGSGKSVLCKKYLDDEKLVLFARAERFVEETHLNSIWDFDIKTMLDFLNGKRIVFFIDALEFIADSSKTKLELLESLYSIVSKYENAYIITSCRSNDNNAFIKLESNYMIKLYEIDEISSKELNLIKEKYPIINKLAQNNSYNDLLKIPFYINIIMSYNINPDCIDDINKLRYYIWENIICLKSKTKKYNIKVSNVRKAIEKIVFDRAKKFVLGVSEKDIDSNIISALISEEIVIRNKEGIRLKYDIFEDICFEQFFDEQFISCKGKYDNFYKKIEKMGRCVYRRYQIWISNKLFTKENQDKFINNLIFSNCVSNEWKKQTEIGILKSNYNDNFFEKNIFNILDNNLLDEFIDICNIYCFDLKLVDFNNEFPKVILIPTGGSRKNIIKIIVQEKLYLKNTINESKVAKLCLDYTNQNNNRLKEIDILVCSILEFFVDEAFQKVDKERFNVIEYIDKYLVVLFKLSETCSEWLKNFFTKLLESYNSKSKKNQRMSEEILQWISENAHYNLVKELPHEMCFIANTLWIKKNSNNEFYYHSNVENDYGLCEDYKYSFQTPNKNVLLWNLFRVNFYIGLDWAIDFINNSVDAYAENSSDNVLKVKIKFVDTNEIKQYYGNNNMWLAGTRDGYVPDLLSDIVFYIKDSIINFIQQNLSDKENVEKILLNIKNKIYSKSNNVILLTVIENIGLHFQNEFPGYALDLVTSIDIINWDTHRYSLYLNNPQLQMLEKQLLLKIGLPEIKYRYQLDKKCAIHIENYAISLQISFGVDFQKRVFKILDYLYTIITNTEDNATNYLQIQKMDMRNAVITEVDKNTSMIETKITGEAKKVTDSHEKQNEIYVELENKIDNYIRDRQRGKNYRDKLLNCIEELNGIINSNSDRTSGYESILICFISIALKEEKLSTLERNNFCDFWITGLEKIFENEVFIFEPQLINILLDQLYEDTSDEIKNKIKKIILKCIINDTHDGIIKQIQLKISQYLLGNSNLSRIIFNTIIKLSEDEMNHQKYNATYVKESGFVFKSNFVPRLSGVDYQLEENSEKKYESLKEQVIQDYLFDEKKLNLDQFNIDDYDIQLLFKIVNCGMTLSNKSFEKILKELLKCMINIYDSCKEDRLYYEIIDTYSEFELVSFIQKELIYTLEYNENVIDFLFKDINFEIFQEEAIEFYQKIMGGFIAEFYDSYNNASRRNICKKKISEVEKRIVNIKNEKVKKQLYKCLFFNASRDCKWNPSEIKTSYSYEDKMFLNRQFSKYGIYYIRDAIKSLYLLNVDELLPEILISVKEILSYNNSNYNILEKELKGDVDIIINMIIIKSFTKYSDKIKLDEELIKSYEDILCILIAHDNEIAGVLIDEFRVH